jgi:hypothetical protein
MIHLQLTASRKQHLQLKRDIVVTELLPLQQIQHLQDALQMLRLAQLVGQMHLTMELVLLQLLSP